MFLTLPDMHLVDKGPCTHLCVLRSTVQPLSPPHTSPNNVPRVVPPALVAIIPREHLPSRNLGNLRIRFAHFYKYNFCDAQFPAELDQVELRSSRMSRVNARTRNVRAPRYIVIPKAKKYMVHVLTLDTFPFPSPSSTTSSSA